MEELLAKHRKEQRDLQNKVTQKKKQASKKTRKGVNDECDSLEAELKARQSAEIAAIHAENGDAETTGAELTELTLEDANGIKANGMDVQDQGDLDMNGINGTSHSQDTAEPQRKKPNRQKARLARRAEEQEEASRQAAEEANNMPDRKQLERERMLASIKERGLREKEIRADGHCLYSAVADQLEQMEIPLGAAPTTDKPNVPYKIVRAAAAEYIKKNKDDFEPFLEEPLESYVQKVRDTGEWGGQLELMALAKSYGTDINVLQDFGRVEEIESGSEQGERVMWLGYYKHGFGLGEHYNSLRRAG